MIYRSHRLSLLMCIKHSHSTDTSNLQSISNKQFFKNYQSGIKLSIQNRLQQSNQQFRQSLKQIVNAQEDTLQHYGYILKRIAHNCRRLGQNQQAQIALYQIIRKKRQNNCVPALLYDDYNILFKHMIGYDLEKSAKLCKALLHREKDDMPVNHFKIFNHNLGIVYLLAGNYVDAKKRFSQCLDADPQGTIKAYALNNLGVACWWHKNPLERTNNKLNQAENLAKISAQFGQAKQLFCKSLFQTEKVSKMEDQYRRLQIEETLSLKTQNLQERLQFQMPQSIFALQNLSNFYLENDPIQKTQILYWLSKALSLSKKHKNQKIFDRLYVEYSLLGSQTQQLKDIVPRLIEKYRTKQQFIEESYYCKILSMIYNLKQDSQLKNKYFLRSQTIDTVLPEWSSKLRYIANDELNLII